MDVVAGIERAVARDVGRGSELLSRHTAGSLRRAAESLLDAPRLDVTIITGFYIPAADPPGAETDGPIGAVQLAGAVLELGGRASLLTDEPCAPVVAAAIEWSGFDVPLAVGALAPYQKKSSHMVAIERVGPSWAGGPPRNMRGEDVSAWTAALERPFTDGDRFKIGIGDGGNEIGMGALPHDVVAEVVRNGSMIHCPVGCDALIVAGTSNWGAAGLVGALAYLRPEADLAALLEPAWSRGILEAIVERGGAVDGVLRAAAPSVDGLSWDSYESVLSEVAGLAKS